MNAFCTISLVLNISWFFEFSWRACLYTKNCLTLGLSTSSFILNLSVKAFDLILQSSLGLDLKQYLDYFVALLPAVKATIDRNRIKNNNYARLTDILGIPQQEIKDFGRTLVPLFGIKVDINLFMVLLPRNQLHKVNQLLAAAFNKQKMTLLSAKMLTSFRSFCAKIVCLGWVLYDLSWILEPNFFLAAQVPIEEVFGKFVIICLGGTTCYQNLTVMCSSTIKNKKLTNCTRMNWWLALGVFTSKTHQLSRRMSRLSKTKPFLPRQKMAKLVIFRKEGEDQWSKLYLKVLMYNHNYWSVSTSSDFEQYCWNFSYK